MKGTRRDFAGFSGVLLCSRSVSSRLFFTCSPQHKRGNSNGTGTISGQLVDADGAFIMSPLAGIRALSEPVQFKPRELLSRVRAKAPQRFSPTTEP